MSLWVLSEMPLPEWYANEVSFWCDSWRFQGLGCNGGLRPLYLGALLPRYSCLLAAIMAAAPHPNAKVCWNSNYPHDLDAQGQLEPHFRLLAGRIGLVHINRLHCGYPYAELFRLLKGTGYEGYCLAELPAAGDVPCATEFLRYYRQCFELLGGA